MMMVRCILVETTVPVRIRPRMETRPVKGHFLSVGTWWLVNFPHAFDFIIRLFPQQSCSWRVPSLEPHHHLLTARASSQNCQPRGKDSETLHVPMYWPSMAFLGVRKPRPTSLYHRRYSNSSALKSSPSFATPIISRESTHATLARTLGLALGDQRDVRLLLESTLRLDGQLGSHVCDCSCRSQRRGEGFGVAITIENKVLSDSFNATQSLSRHLKSRKRELATLTS